MVIFVSRDPVGVQRADPTSETMISEMVFPTEKNYLTTTNRKYEKESDNLLGTVGSRKKYNC